MAKARVIFIHFVARQKGNLKLHFPAQQTPGGHHEEDVAIEAAWPSLGEARDSRDFFSFLPAVKNLHNTEKQFGFLSQATKVSRA